MKNEHGTVFQQERQMLRTNLINIWTQLPKILVYTFFGTMSSLIKSLKE